MKRKFFVSLIILLVLRSTNGFAITVEKLILSPRIPGLFKVNITAVQNSQTNQTLVLWERSAGTPLRHSIWGKLLQPAGQPLGPDFLIINGPNAQRPGVVYNPDANQFALFYSNQIGAANRFQVQGVKLSSTGRRLGQPVRISFGTDVGKNIANYIAKVIYDPTAKSYVVLWLRYRFSSNVNVVEGLYAVVLNLDLTLRTGPVLLSPLVHRDSSIAGPYVTDVQFHTRSKKLLLAGYTISNEPGFSFQYFVAKVDPTLKSTRIVLIRLKPGLSTGAAPHASLMTLPNGQLVGFFVEGTGVKKRQINSAANPIGAVTLFFNDPVRTTPLEFPVSATAKMGSRAQTLVLGQDDSSTQTGKLWLQLAAPSGNAAGPPFELQSGIDIVYPPFIIPLPATVPNGFLYAVIFVEGVQRGQPGDSSGLSLLRVNTAP